MISTVHKRTKRQLQYELAELAEKVMLIERRMGYKTIEAQIPLLAICKELNLEIAEIEQEWLELHK
jgi:hypothetical protein